MLEAEAWPLTRDAPSWRANAIDFRQQASNQFTPSMAQRIASRVAPDALDDRALGRRSDHREPPARLWVFVL